MCGWTVSSLGSNPAANESYGWIDIGCDCWCSSNADGAAPPKPPAGGTGDPELAKTGVMGLDAAESRNANDMRDEEATGSLDAASPSPAAGPGAGRPACAGFSRLEKFISRALDCRSSVSGRAERCWAIRKRSSAAEPLSFLASIQTRRDFALMTARDVT